MGASDGRDGVEFGLFARTERNPAMGRIMDQAPVAAALDYDSTLIGALELSSKKWVLAIQSPGSRYSHFVKNATFARSCRASCGLAKDCRFSVMYRLNPAIHAA